MKCERDWTTESFLTFFTADFRLSGFSPVQFLVISERLKVGIELSTDSTDIDPVCLHKHWLFFLYQHINSRMGGEDLRWFSLTRLINKFIRFFFFFHFFLFCKVSQIIVISISDRFHLSIPFSLPIHMFTHMNSEGLPVSELLPTVLTALAAVIH